MVKKRLRGRFLLFFTIIKKVDGGVYVVITGGWRSNYGSLLRGGVITEVWVSDTRTSWSLSRDRTAA